MDYCARIQENLLYDENNVFYEKIEEGIEFWEWLYGQKGSGKEDDRRMLMEIFSKQKPAVNLWEDENARTINCGLGKALAWVSDEQTYVWCGIKKLTAYSQGFHNKTKRIRRYSKQHVNMTMNTKYRQ